MIPYFIRALFNCYGPNVNTVGLRKFKSANAAFLEEPDFRFHRQYLLKEANMEVTGRTKRGKKSTGDVVVRSRAAYG